MSGPSSLFPTMPRVWPPAGWCRACDGSPGPRPAPEEPPGSPQPSVAEREAPVPQFDWTTPPLLPSPRTSQTSAQHSGSSNPDTSSAAQYRIQAGTPQAAVVLTQPELYHPQLNPDGLQQCARCGLVARAQHLQYRNGCSWLCDFHFAVADLGAELCTLGHNNVKRTRITEVVKSARDICLTPTG